ncbi:MAG: hypothetical protein J6J31_09115 [Thermoguttaceae bacterium]|nr:hypothetical protein [Thermoguttaceae bacterium]
MVGRNFRKPNGKTEISGRSCGTVRHSESFSCGSAALAEKISGKIEKPTCTKTSKRKLVKKTRPLPAAIQPNTKADPVSPRSWKSE